MTTSIEGLGIFRLTCVVALCLPRPTAAYYKRLTSDDDETRLVAGRAWSRWEMSTSRLRVSKDDLDRAESDDWANAFARIESHYFVNAGWMRDGQLLEKQSIDKIRHIPTKIAQGRVRRPSFRDISVQMGL